MDIIGAILMFAGAIGLASVIFWLAISNILDITEEDVTEELEQTLERDLREFWL